MPRFVIHQHHTIEIDAPSPAEAWRKYSVLTSKEVTAQAFIGDDYITDVEGNLVETDDEQVGA
jgi:hypothetical protein